MHLFVNSLSLIHTINSPTGSISIRCLLCLSLLPFSMLLHATMERIAPIKTILRPPLSAT